MGKNKGIDEGLIKRTTNYLSSLIFLGIVVILLHISWGFLASFLFLIYFTNPIISTIILILMAFYVVFFSFLVYQTFHFKKESMMELKRYLYGK